MTSGWYFKEPLRNETENFLISKFCFPWLVYTLTPSNSTHYYLTSSNLPFNTEIAKKFPAESKTTENLHMYSVKDKVLLVNSSALISKQKSSFMIRINTGDWSLCELSTLVISMCNNHRWAERIENRKKNNHGNVLSQRGGVSQYTHEPYGHKERKWQPQFAWKIEETVSIL